MNILILAAGLGSRLRPLTDVIPKPLLPVCDRTLLDHQLAAVVGVPHKQILVNAHHLADQIAAFAAERKIDHVYHEPQLLGTGGPLRRIWQEGRHDDLLVLNGDILHDLDLYHFVRQAEASDADFALALTDDPTVNTVQVNDDGQVSGVDRNYTVGTAAEKATFAGISWYKADTLSRIAAEQFSVVDFWAAEAAVGRLPAAIRAPKLTSWIDIGTPAGLYQAAFRRLGILGRPHWGPADVFCRGSIIHDGTTIATGAELDNCLVLPGARVPAGRWQRAIFIPGQESPWQC